MNLTDLASFVRVVELGTLAAAARAEGVPKSTLSRRIARLEQDLGVALVRRSARAFALTEDGRLLFERAGGPLRELARVGQALVEADQVPRGRLVLTAPHDLGASGEIVSLVVELRRLHPEVQVELRLEDRVVDLVTEGVDVAIRAHAGEVPGSGELMVRALGQGRLGVFASPAWVAAHGAPQRPHVLLSADLILHRAALGRQVELQGPGGPVALDPSRAVVLVNDFRAVRDLLLAGLGVGLLPLRTPGQGRVDPGLVRLLPDWSAVGGRVSLVWPASRHLAPRVRAFLDLATQRLGIPASSEA
ncbi:LysR family transcriptional regulator [Myxococcota bacterium]|nr:LysR family transcriptional regulator [Myxococcota bacterium]